MLPLPFIGSLGSTFTQVLEDIVVPAQIDKQRVDVQVGCQKSW